MSKKRSRRYRIKAYTNMRNPFAVAESGFHRQFFVGGSMSFSQAVRGISRMKQIYPSSFRYRIVRGKK